MNKYVGIITGIATAITALMAVFSQGIQDYVAAHPAIGAVIAAIATIVAAFSKAAGGSEQK